MSFSIAKFHHAEFAGLQTLLEVKKSQGLRVSLCIPVLNEEDTIGEVVRCLKQGLIDDIPLVDEMAVIDSGSTDRTREVAVAAGADVCLASEILPETGVAAGKGENIWKAVHHLTGDILCFVDGDVRNMHPRFVYGPLGVLLMNPSFLYSKGFYDRPHAAVEMGVRPAGGGRVTEALVRPLFSYFFPELASLVQPLAGEYAARRTVLESIPMPTGYGVETAHLLDIYHKWGSRSIAQCDLDERIHRHQDTGSIGRMSFSILSAFFSRAQATGVVDLKSAPADVYRHFVREEGAMRLIESPLADIERPPLDTIAAYRRKFPRG